MCLSLPKSVCPVRLLTQEWKIIESSDSVSVFAEAQVTVWAIFVSESRL